MIKSIILEELFGFTVSIAARHSTLLLYIRRDAMSTLRVKATEYICI